MSKDIQQCLQKTEHYDILGLPMFSSEEEVKKAYKKLALKFHPDRNSEAGSREAFNKITTSYSFLTNSLSKIAYDQRERMKKQYGNRKRQTPHFDFYQKAEFFAQETDKAAKAADKKKQQFEKAYYKFAEKFQQDQARFNRKNKGYNEEYMNERKQKYKEDKERREKEQREKRKTFNNNKLFAIFGLLFLFIFLLDPYLTPQSKKQAFSLSQTDVHKFTVRTAKLNNEFFVSKEYFGENFSSSRKENIERVIDERIVTNLKKQCKKTHGKKGKKGSNSSCVTLMEMVEKQPQYIQSLLTNNE